MINNDNDNNNNNNNNNYIVIIIIIIITLLLHSYIVDVACPFDTRVQDKEREKVEKYQDLKRELKRIWQSQEIVTIPIIIGTLGTVSKNFEHCLRKLDIMVNFSTLQKACLLGSARVIRKVLDT